MVLVFDPLYMARVWGGRRLATLFGRSLPADVPTGESWELVDRPEAQSVVRGGPCAGLTLHALWTAHREEIFGRDAPGTNRFPFLVKLIDARRRLSLQVHPPPAVAASLGGEPKSELWVVLDADEGAELFIGLNPGVTRERFAQALQDGTVESLLGRMPARRGDHHFVRSGQLHALGAGLVLAEIQQNSDTTYRVFDWNRPGLDGRPRALHVPQAMLSIDFTDETAAPARGVVPGEHLARCASFTVERWDLDEPRRTSDPGQFAVFLCTRGSVRCAGHSTATGGLFLVPASFTDAELQPIEPGSQVVRVTFG